MSNPTMNFTPVEVGDLSDIPPEAPEGLWVASFETNVRPTKEEGFPMIEVKAFLEESLDGHPCPSLPLREYLIFYPKAHRNARMATQRLNAFCRGKGIDVPRLERIESAADLADFCRLIEADKNQVQTRHSIDKRSGETRTNFIIVPAAEADAYGAPGAFGGPEEVVNAKAKKKKSAA